MAVGGGRNNDSKGVVASGLGCAVLTFHADLDG